MSRFSFRARPRGRSIRLSAPTDCPVCKDPGIPEENILLLLFLEDLLTVRPLHKIVGLIKRNRRVFLCPCADDHLVFAIFKNTFGSRKSWISSSSGPSIIRLSRSHEIPSQLSVMTWYSLIFCGSFRFPICLVRTASFSAHHQSAQSPKTLLPQVPDDSESPAAAPCTPGGVPVNQILADCMSPVHIIPLLSKRIQLIKKMIITLKPAKSIRIIIPVHNRRKMILLSVRSANEF